MSLEGKVVVVVTGASAGIGRATVRELAARGADVGLIARGEERLQAAAREVEQAGRRACVAPADVADADAVEAAAVAPAPAGVLTERMQPPPPVSGVHRVRADLLAEERHGVHPEPGHAQREPEPDVLTISSRTAGFVMFRSGWKGANR